MIVRRRLQDLEEVLDQARDQMVFKSPQVQVIETGVYKVSGSGKWYDVTCGRRPDGQLFVACTCFANLHRKHCYHALSAFETHLAIKIKQIYG